MDKSEMLNCQSNGLFWTVPQNTTILWDFIVRQWKKKRIDSPLTLKITRSNIFLIWLNINQAIKTLFWNTHKSEKIEKKYPRKKQNNFFLQSKETISGIFIKKKNEVYTLMINNETFIRKQNKITKFADDNSP